MDGIRCLHLFSAILMSISGSCLLQMGSLAQEVYPAGLLGPHLSAVTIALAYLMGSVMLADAIINTSALIKGTKMHISQENIVSYLGLMFFCQLACSITAYNLTCNVADAMNEVTADMLQLYNFICFLFACMQLTLFVSMMLAETIVNVVDYFGLIPPIFN